jgi:hypothetical protein
MRLLAIVVMVALLVGCALNLREVEREAPAMLVSRGYVVLGNDGWTRRMMGAELWYRVKVVGDPSGEVYNVGVTKRWNGDWVIWDHGTLRGEQSTIVLPQSTKAERP